MQQRVSHELDTAATIPGTAAVGTSATSRCDSVITRLPAVLVDPVETEECRDQPADGREEREGDVRLPGSAAVVESDARPVEGASSKQMLASHST